MPIHQLIHIAPNSYMLVWRIEETEADLLGQLPANHATTESYQQFSHPRRRLEWLAARLALKELCGQLDITYQGIAKDAQGKPYLLDSTWHISLSHSFPFAVVAIAKNAPIGIDIQALHSKLEAVCPKYLNKLEKQDSTHDLEKLGIYWCAKEALYKAYEAPGLSFIRDIQIQPFTKSKQGILEGQVKGATFIIHYQFISDHVLAWCQRKEFYEQTISA